MAAYKEIYKLTDCNVHMLNELDSLLAWGRQCKELCFVTDQVFFFMSLPVVRRIYFRQLSCLFWLFVNTITQVINEVSIQIIVLSIHTIHMNPFVEIRMMSDLQKC